MNPAHRLAASAVRPFPDDGRARRRTLILGSLALAHVGLLVLIAQDRVTLASERRAAGTLTLWMARVLPTRDARRLPEPPPPSRALPTPPPLGLPNGPVATTPQATTIEAPSTPSAPPAIDPRLSGQFGDTTPASAPALAASDPLKLEIGKDFYDKEREREQHLTPAQEAMRDPRSNHLELTPAEKRLLAWGEVECIAWLREPDGRIYRGPGHWRRVTAVQPGTHEVRECVH